MTEIPEHLRKRAEAAKAKAKGATDAPAGDAAPAGGAPPSDDKIPSHLLDRGTAAADQPATVAGGLEAPTGSSGPDGHNQRLLTVVKSGSIQDTKATPQDKVHVWPHLLLAEFLAALAITLFSLLFSIFVNAPLLELADFNKTPNPSKAPWYFLGLQEMLVYYDPWLAGVVFPTFIINGLMAIPYIDMNPKGNGYYTFKQRRFAISTFLFGFIVLWVTLIILGTFLRGPNWNFFGPYAYWDPHMVESLNNVNLAEYVYLEWLGRALPSNILLRELPGFLTVIAYFAVLPPLLANLVFRKMYKDLGFIRYQTMVFFLLCMAALPLKMVLRWTVNLKYIVAIPEYFFNI